ncbi:ankyrin repeat-containing domain protein [Immersiella caudata]|uniref:GPI inositol-deacylase n=1 Tax=Immersiella caudata TaxID=314043 RepID=A0AA40CAH8_9PEZI|nr:ankyrin repeat-containing domain protein [Immersiella caudata]
MWDEKDDKSFNWLKSDEGLKKDFPKARVMLYCYASAYKGSYKIKQYMDNIATIMLDALQLKRENSARRPIVLIGHSMGGLVAAKVLTMTEICRDKYPNMYEGIVGVFTFGTPFGGAPVAEIASEWIKLNRATGLAVDSKLVDLMKPGSEWLRELRKEFVRSAGKLGQKVDLHCFWERLPTEWDDIIEKLAGTAFPQASLNRLRLNECRDFVSRELATLDGAQDTGLARTHRNLVRFEGFKDDAYQLVRAPLKRVVHAASLSAKERFNSTRQSSISRSDLTSVINSLEGADVERRFRDIKRRVGLAPDPWILREPECQAWFESEGELRDDYLWIHGREGKGKTAAATAIINKIQSTINRDDMNQTDRFPDLLAYFFCDQAPDYCTAEDVVKSLLRQLCQQQDVLATYAKQFVSRKDQDRSSGNNKAALGIENLWQSLLDMLTETSIGTIYFVLCNLHELPEDDESTRKLLSFIRKATQDSALDAEIDTGPEFAQRRKRVRTKWLFATRDRLPIRRVLDENPAVRNIDLSDEKYGDMVQRELQQHAWTKVHGLQKKKGYNKATSYYAGSVLGNQAESTKWIDVAVVQLAALPDNANHIRVRKLLERVPQDFATLLHQAWKTILVPHEGTVEAIKELLRALVLTYENPTESELLVLAGLSSDDKETSEGLLRELIGKCKPLLQRIPPPPPPGAGGTTRPDEFKIGFLNQDVKRHLQRESELKDLLGLDRDAVRLQHGILALNCFSHIRDSIASETLPVPDQAPHQEAAQGVVGTASKTADASLAGALGAVNDSSAIEESQLGEMDEEDSDGEGYDELDGEEGDDSDANYFGTMAGAPDGDNTIEANLKQWPTSMLPYATKHWLQHASEASPDIAGRLVSLERDFWEAGSEIRQVWLTEFQRLTGRFGGFPIDKNIKALHVAATVGFPRLVESLVNAGYAQEVNEYDSFINTPLHLAAYFGRTDNVEQLLLIKDINTDDAGPDGTASTPLSMAAASGKIAAMTQLLDHGADPNSRSNWFGPVISAAILSGNGDAVRLLLERGAKLNHPNISANHLRPLALAAQYSDITMFEIVLAAGRESLDSDEYGGALVAACTSGRIEVVTRLIEFQLDREHFQNSLNRAYPEQNWDVVKLLLQNMPGLDCNDAFYAAATDVEHRVDVLTAMWGCTSGAIDKAILDKSLYEATDSEKESTVKALLEMGADPNAQGEQFGNALTAAANDGTDAIVQALLDAGAIPTSPSGWALQAAAQQGHASVVTTLLDRGADVNHFSPSHASRTALQAACDCGHSDVVKILIQAGANPNLGGGPSERPIFIAADTRPEVLPHLLAAEGIELNIVGGPEDTSPLCNAAAFLPLECVKALVDAGADVNLVDDEGDTALMSAAGVGEGSCVRFLLRQGANLVTENPESEGGYDTALEAALETLFEELEENKAKGEKECVDLLASRAVVILKELKKRADAGDPTAQEILAFEKETRVPDMADESAEEDREQKELENGLGNLTLGGDDTDD